MFKNLTKYRITSSVTGKKTFLRNPDSAKQVKASYYGNTSYNTNHSAQGLNIANSQVSSQSMLRFLDGFINTEDPKELRKKYKDMYYFDNIAGTAVDLRSQLPFSDFSLIGISDSKVLQTYETCLNEMKTLPFLGKAMVDYFVYGQSVFSLLFDPNRKIFLSPRALDLNNCTFYPTPLLNDDPIIDYGHDEWLKPFERLYSEGDPRAKAYFDKHGLADINKYMMVPTGDTFKLDPETTLYLERNDLSVSDKTQVSYFARALKFYEYEKRIYRGTLDLSEKRLKSILHLTIGSEQFIPQYEDMTEISNAFMAANEDPTNGIVATPWYVQSQEIRQPTDFWRYDEIYDFVSRGKMTALGINEQFLSGDMNVSTMEASLSVFLDQMRTDRQYITDTVFYKKIFPYLARENNFIADDDKAAIRDMIQESKDVKINPLMQDKMIQQKIKYQIPTIQWHKSLKPQGDKDYMDLLASLTDQGIPIPYKMWLASVGIDPQELLNEYSESDTFTKAAQEYRAKLEGGGLGGDDFGGSFDDYNNEGPGLEEETPSESPAEEPKTFEASSLRPIGIKNRVKLGDLNGPAVQEYFKLSRENKGKMKGLTKNEANYVNEQFNKAYASVLKNKAEQMQYEENKQFQENKTKIMFT